MCPYEPQWMPRRSGFIQVRCRTHARTKQLHGKSTSGVRISRSFSLKKSCHSSLFAVEL